MTLSEQLKLTTTPLHRQLDQLPILRNLLSPNLNRTDYEAVILFFYHAFKTWQPILDQASNRLKPPEFSIIDTQLTSLKNEVEGFHLKLTSNIRVPTPVIDSIEGYLGYSYVLTGSQVGAQFILKKLLSSTLASDYTFDYYKSLNEQGADFKHWKSELDLYVEAGPMHSQLIIEGASQCFMQLIDLFDQKASLGDHLKQALA